MSATQELQDATKKDNENEKKKDLDRILDSALDDLSDDSDDDVEIEGKRKNTSTQKQPPEKPSGNPQKNGEEMLAASLEQMMKSFIETMDNENGGTNYQDEEQVHQDLTNALKQIEEQMKMSMASMPSNDNVDKAGPDQNKNNNDREKKIEKKEIPQPSSKEKGKKKKDIEEVDKTVAKILNDMAKAGATVPDNDVGGLEPSQVEAMGEEIMQEMMREFEHMGQKGDADEVVNGMMQQLLAKEIMYEPMKQVHDKFPEWLAKNKAFLSKTDYERYGRQYQGFQRIVHVYENDPNNFPRLMELMQDIQEYGQPPAEIVQELAPDLEFDSEGMPKMGPGAMPPFPGGGEQCPMM